MEILLPTHTTSGCHITTFIVPPSSVDMSYGRASSFPCECHITTSAATTQPTADMLNCVCNLSTGYGSTHPDVMCPNDESMSFRHPPSSCHHQITPERWTVTFMTTSSFADTLSRVRKLPAPYGPTHPFLMRFHASLGAGHCRDSKDTSTRCVPSSSHPAPVIKH